MTSEEKIALLETQVADMAERIGDLEVAVFLQEDDAIELDELETAHLEFAGLVRARREGSA